MTTIVWDGVTLAADSRITSDNVIISDEINKIMKPQINLRGEKVKAMSLTGICGIDDEVIQCLEQGAMFEEREYDCGFGGILITDTRAYMFDIATVPHLHAVEYATAMGSGREFALSALRMGMNAEQAVKHAIKLDSMSGGKINKIKLR